MPKKNEGVKIQVRGQRIQGSSRQHINQTIDIGPPRISGSIDEKLAVLDSLGVALHDPSGEPMPGNPSQLALAAGFTQLEYKRTYPYWVSTDIV